MAEASETKASETKASETKASETKASEKQIWAVQVVCDEGHSICAYIAPAADLAEAEAHHLAAIRHQLAQFLQSGALKPYCGVCQAPAEEWRIELAPTLLFSMEEAKAIMSKRLAEGPTATPFFVDVGPLH